MKKLPLAILIVAAGLFSLAKGWGIIFTFPFWLVASPVLWFNLRTFSDIKDRMGVKAADKILFYLFPLAYVLTMICAVGAGDTQDVIVFGVFTSDSTGSLDEFSQAIANVSLWALFALAIYTTYRLHVWRHRLNMHKQTNILFWFSFIILCLLALGLLRSTYSDHHRVPYCDGKPVSEYPGPLPNYCKY